MEAVVIGLVLGSGYVLSRNEQSKTTNPKKHTIGKRLGTQSINGGSSLAKGKSASSSLRTTPVKGSHITRAHRGKVPRGRPDKAGYHTNMFPFFGSTIKQNTDPNANTQILDFMVGAGSMDIGKREVPQMFNRERENIGTPFGAPNQIGEIRSHFNESRLRQNELPFKQIRSGPGLNDGYTNIPSGGVHQSATREAALRRYKTVDELRPGNDPKVQYAGVTMNPEAHIKSRGIMGEFKHRNPDKFYVNENGERNLVTTGQFYKGRVYPQPVDRAVNRPSTTREYFGVQKSVDTNHSYVRPAIKQSSRMASKTLPPGPSVYSQAGGTAGGGAGGTSGGGDYGRDGYQALPNQRAITGTRTKLGPVAGAGYSVQVGPNHYPDEARFSRKMYFEGAAREFGNMQSTYPKGLPAKDPNDIAKPTIREQTEDNDYIGIAAPANTVQSSRLRTDYEAADTMTSREQIANTKYVGIAAPANTVHSSRLRTDYDAADTMTTREQTGETNWVAPGKSDIPWERNRDSVRNMRQNRTKERISRGRRPAPQGVKIASGKQAVRIKTRKIESDYFNQYERMPTDLHRVTTNRSVLGKTQIRPRQGERVHLERSDPAYLHPLKSNPYVISVAGRPPQSTQKIHR